MGANQIYDDKLGFSSPAKEKESSNRRFGSITETEPEKLKKHIQEVLPELTFHEIKDVLSVIYKIKQNVSEAMYLLNTEASTKALPNRGCKPSSR